MSTEKDRALADALERIGIALGKLAAAMADHEHRIDALERRIEKLEKRMDGKDDMDGEMLLSIGKRLCAIERKLNHKGGDE